MSRRIVAGRREPIFHRWEQKVAGKCDDEKGRDTTSVTGHFVAAHAPWPKRGEKSDSLNEKLKAGEPTKGLGFEELALAGASFKKARLRQSSSISGRSPVKFHTNSSTELHQKRSGMRATSACGNNGVARV